MGVEWGETSLKSPFSQEPCWSPACTTSLLFQNIIQLYTMSPLDNDVCHKATIMETLPKCSYGPDWFGYWASGFSFMECEAWNVHQRLLQKLIHPKALGLHFTGEFIPHTYPAHSLSFHPTPPRLVVVLHVLSHGPS